MNRYILNAGAVLHKGKPIFEIFHNGESVYRIADGLSRAYPNLASIFANYPNVLPFVAEYPSLANTLSQYPSLASYPDEVLTAVGKYPSAAPYLLGLKAPDFDYPIKWKSNITTPYTNTQVKGFRLLMKPEEDVVSPLTSGNWSSDNSFYITTYDNTPQIGMGYQHVVFSYKISDSTKYRNKNMEWSCIDNTVTLLIPESSISVTRTITRYAFSGRTITLGATNIEISVFQLYAGNSNEIHRLFPLSKSSVYDTITSTVLT